MASERLTEEELNEWFKVFDADGSGKVDADELRAVLRGYYEWRKEKYCDAKIEADVAVRCFILLP